ncbi:DUF6311 domain-containing protein [Collimonas arenae]|nr:DUF6311 domain-containing protein [Collimonas arenae]
MIRKISPVFWAALIGLVAFVFYTGGAIVWPTYTEWLMRGDFAQHYLGWSFFRHTPLLQFPLGANWAYGEVLGSSIVFTDSTPLFAFLFKPFASLLPEPFQYIGLWLALTAMLQGIFAYKLLSLFSTDRGAVLLATAFFVIAPPLWWRINIECDALASHWLILAGLYLYFRENFRQRDWIGLLCVATLTHAYLLAMVLAIWCADVLQRWLKKQISLQAALLNGLSAAACLALVMWVTGYFMLHGGLSTPVGLGYYRMSLLALFDPLAGWSSILPEQPRSGGQYDGFSFLGIGVLALLVLAALQMLVAGKRRATLEWRWSTLLPLLAIALALTAIALTNYVGWGDYDLFTYQLPRWLQWPSAVFRASGRMFWPVFYLIYVAVFYTAFKLIGKKGLTYLLAGLLVLQLIDSNGATQMVRKEMREHHWTSPVQSIFWQHVAKNYRRIAVALPLTYPWEYFALSLFASNNGMSINNGYFARVDLDKLGAVQRQTAETVFTGRYDPQTLYVFFHDPLSSALWEQAKLNAGPDDFMGEVDGYQVLAPGWRRCGECSQLQFASSQAAAKPAPAYALGTSIDFRSTGNADLYRIGNWSVPETWGRWTDGNAAAVWLSVPDQTRGDLTLEISGHALVTAQHPLQVIPVSVNGRALGELRFTEQNHEGISSFHIPADVVANSHGNLYILMTIADPVSPMQLMIRRDSRGLGLGAVSMVIH